MRIACATLSMLILFGSSLCAASNQIVPQDSLPADEGIRFSCRPEQLKNIESDFDSYLKILKIDASLVIKKMDPTSVVYTLNTRDDDSNTLDLQNRAVFKIEDESVLLPARSGKYRKVSVVSKKEILLALLQRGRLTEFKGDACAIDALKDHLGIRQNIVAWSEKLNWIFPNGKRAKWHKKYWTRGTPKRGFPLHEAVTDVFINQNKYSIGCYS